MKSGLYSKQVPPTTNSVPCFWVLQLLINKLSFGRSGSVRVGQKTTELSSGTTMLGWVIVGDLGPILQTFIIKVTEALVVLEYVPLKDSA